MDVGFPAGQAARLAEISYRTLDFWATSRFIVPSIMRASGKGSDRAYSFRDVVALRVAGKLRRSGISLQSLRKVVEYLQQCEAFDSPLTETFLISAGNDVFEKRGDEILSVLRRPGQSSFSWVLDLSGVVEEIKQQLAS